MSFSIQSDALNIAIQNDIFLHDKNYLKTKLGIVVKCSLSTNIPNGWRKLTRNEGTQIKNQLLKIMDIWSIVAFQDGKIDGSGYGSKIHLSYGSQCGQVFLIKTSNQFIAPPTVPNNLQGYFGNNNANQNNKQFISHKNFQNQHPPYLNQNNNYNEKNALYSKGFVQQQAQYTPNINNFEQQFLKKYKNRKTGLGLVAKCPLNCQIPAGWRILRRQQGQQIKNELNQFLNEWSIVAFQNGKIDGFGYGNQIHNSYGNQCGQMFVITFTN